MRRLGVGLALLLLAGVAGCGGKTVMLEVPSAESSHALDPGAQPVPVPEPTPPTPAPSAGWWPPTPPPTGPLPGSPPAEPPPAQPPEGEVPAGEAPEAQAPPETERPYTFPDWDEHIYDARNTTTNEAFLDRPTFASCGDFASPPGAHLISPAAAECLEEGRAGEGRESAVAVQQEGGGVHVWFVRVSPEGVELYVDQTQDGGPWLHATCDPQVPIAALSCEEPQPAPEPAPETEPDVGEPGDGPAPEDPAPESPAPAEPDPARSDAPDTAPADPAPAEAPEEEGAGVED